ncbi:MAG: NUDIX hydrolase [Planctomycetota bacterium]|nr:MAG: NUDIX hydrolase [Planctomycetota bacterium]
MKKVHFIKRRLKYDGTKYSFQVDEIKDFQGKKGIREQLIHPGAVALVVLDEDERIILNRQYRYTVDEVLYEIPAGTLEDGESPLHCAKREIVEETGYEAGELTLLCKYYSSPGISTEFIYLYLARDLKKITDHPIGHKEEGIENYRFTLKEAKKMALDGKLMDAKTILGILHAYLYLDKLKRQTRKQQYTQANQTNRTAKEKPLSPRPQKTKRAGRRKKSS